MQREGTPGETRGLPRTTMRPGNNAPRKRGDLRVMTRKRALGATGLIGLTLRRDPLPAHQVILQVTYGVEGGRGVTGAW